ncbi:hypothetical protein HBB16_08260 [Pseudonocardia sp. MCCB 268]|nr:hypothetical protein [Pseudonocardia cytotoxica]
MPCGCCRPSTTTIAERKDLVARGPGGLPHVTPISGLLDPRDQGTTPEGRVLLVRHPATHGAPQRDVFRYITNGGGWGNPLEQRPERVLHDVRDEYFSIGRRRARPVW